MPFCASCGRGTSGAFCESCGVTTSTYDPLRDGAPKDPSRARRLSLNRSPFQVLLLDYATFGSYTLFWLMRERRFAEMRLERKPLNLWFWLCAIVPFVNVWLIFSSLALIGDRAKAARVFPIFPFGLQGFALLIVSAMWRFPEPYWVASTLAPIFLATIHTSVWRAELVDGTAKPERLNACEIAFVVFGALLVPIAFLGTVSDGHYAAAWFVEAVGAAMLVSLAGFAWFDRSIVASSAASVVESSGPGGGTH